jgi:limonene-1,2-epoxide hydrolase
VTDAAAVVNSFLARICARDLEGALELVTDDCEYDNVPIRKVSGPDGIRATLAPFLAGCTGVDWIVHHQAAEGDVVMNERTDRFEMGGRWVELGVAGLFVVRDGRIALWRDYFDLPTFQKAMAGD